MKLTNEDNMDRSISYKWRSIEDYKIPAERIRIHEMISLSAVWEEQREILGELEALVEFNERLQREWAIETGLLERIYTLDRGVTQMLLEKGIDASLIPHGKSNKNPEQVVAIIKDQKNTVEGLFQFVRGERQLSTAYIKELHAQLTRNQETTTAVDQFGNMVEVKLLRGEYKQNPNNPVRPDGSIHEYCPPIHVSSEMEKLVEIHLSHFMVPPEVEAAWIHHRFTQIHPFQDGNGRVARALASLVFIKAGWFPLVIRDTKEERERYIRALEASDFGDLAPLVGVFSAAQKKTFVEAIGISGQIKKAHRIDHEIKAIRDKLEERTQKKQTEWGKAKDTAKFLQNYANNRLDSVIKLLCSGTGHLSHGIDFYMDSENDMGDRSYYFRLQIVETATQLGYYANTQEYRAWSRAVLKSESQSEILISFHATGHEYRGVLAVSACFFRREETEADERQIANIVPLSDEIFQINYKEEKEEIEPRFKEWLENVLTAGLEIWRMEL